jgi:DNA-binding NarL/FixJ family response regulator
VHKSGISEDSDIASFALRHWASGYLLKKSAAFELIKAIRDTLQGKSYVTPRVAEKLLKHFVMDPNSDHKRALTARQREVLQLLAEGRTMRETAETLQVTPRTGRLPQIPDHGRFWTQ